MRLCQTTIPKRKSCSKTDCRSGLKLLFLLVFAFFFTASFSQDAVTDSVDATLFKTVYNQYVKGAGGSLALYNGAGCEGAYPRVTGSAFWSGNGFQKGTVLQV
jgi:hypothetical protein